MGERVAACLPSGAVGPSLTLDAQQLVHARASGITTGRRIGVCAGGSPTRFRTIGSFIERAVSLRLPGRGHPSLVRKAGQATGSRHGRSRSLGALLSRAVCAPRTVSLGECGLQARRGRGSVARQARDLLAVVRDDAVDAGKLAGRRLVGILGGLARASRGRQGRARLFDLSDQRSILGAGDAGALVKHIWILAARGKLGGRAQGNLLARGHQRAAQALGDRGERLPVGGRLIERRRGRTFRILQARHLGARGRNLSLQGGSALRGRLIRGLERGQLGQRGCQVVREQAGLRVAHARLNEGSAPGDARLAGQGPQLPANLIRQVQDAHEVRVHVGQFLQRPLLAAPVFEDAGGLFDEAAPLLGRGRQDRVELALANNDVHLAAHARVRQQLLNVQEPHGRAVDGILRAATAKQGAADRHLGILDVEQTVGVVDRQVHLGAPQRSAPRCPREDNVRHVRAA